jgi:hypothetical protein
MNKLEMQDLEIQGLDLSVSNDDGNTTLVFNGSIDMENPGAILEPYFDTLHDKIAELRIKKIRCDFRSLTYINSSGIKSLLHWILKDHYGAPEKKYSFEILINEDLRWQADGIGFIKKIAPDIISIRKA